MTVTVVGAGAIGGVTGAALARAGHDVLLVDQAADHVAAINAGGLTIATPDGAWTVPGPRGHPRRRSGRARARAAGRQGAAHRGRARRHRAPPGRRRAPSCRSRTGSTSPSIAARVGAARTVGCLVNWAADWVAPGRIQHGGAGTFAIGELDGELSARVKELAELLGAVTPVQVTGQHRAASSGRSTSTRRCWSATALVDAHVYEVVERSPAIQRMLVALVAEGMAVAEAEGVRLEAFDEFDPAWYRAGRGRGRGGRRAGDGGDRDASTGATRRPRPASGGTWRSGSGRPRSRRTSARRSSGPGATASRPR